MTNEEKLLIAKNDALKKELAFKNRELEIEAALESVRTVAMSMSKADDMLDVCKTISNQLQLLNVKEIRNVQTAIFYNEKGTYMNYEYYEKHNKTFITDTTYNNNEKHAEFAENMQKGNGQFFELNINGDEVKDWIAYQKTTNVFIDDFLYTASSLNYYWFSLGPVALGISTYAPLKEEDKVLFKRFVKVFELAYRRYLDIEKAEEQSRESQIQLALERVRARTMAMHHSDELAETSSILFKQIKELGFETWSCGFCIWTENDIAELWMGADSGGLLPPMMIPYKEEHTHYDIYKAWQQNKSSHHKIWEGKELEEHYAFLQTIPSVKIAIKQLNEAGQSLPEKQCYYVGFFKQGYLLLITKEPNEALQDLSKRFASVFDLTYTRFLDLQKAEAQAREAQIEAALEKVRSRSLAMHQSGELIDVIAVMFEKLRELSVLIGTIGIWLFDKKTMNSIFWVGNDLQEPAMINLPYDEKLMEEDTNYRDSWQAWLSGENYINKEYSLEQKNKYFNYVFANNDFNAIPAPVRETILQAQKYIASIIIENNSSLFVDSWNDETYSEASINVLKRIAKVFEQAYVRFLDLQKAEAQSRESKIELSLERVRAKTMAMHNSTDVGETAAVMVDELKKLGIETIRCGIGIMHEPGDMEVWTISTDENNKTDIVIGWLDMNMHPLLNGAFESWRNKIESYSYELKDEDLLNYYNAINNYPGYPIRYDTSTLPKQIYHNEFHFAEGTLFAFSLQQLTDEQRKIFKRFAGVFGQTYRRYLDLKRAESQAREAQIEAALERVRSRTLAMQKSGELAETSAVLFKQLIGLGIEPHRLYISIMKDNDGESEFWITDEDGTKVSAAYTDNLNANASFKKMYYGWKEGKPSMIIDMQGKELQDYFQHLTSLDVPFKDGLKQKRRIQHIAYFNRGFIGMAAPDEQAEETIHLLERFAAVFNLTFTRFSDLKIAEAHAIQAEQDLIDIKAARKKAEEALNELQVTQNQLIQKEKMASLGELTAGIAHEIQNPLNFVNNFSEVSRELLDEMREALKNGDKDEAEELANDIIQNLEKINYHGKRADAIVKGMLQHSRQTSGAKEPTDINALCDEYLRLSYHGLRAKDKSFNADFKTNFDESIGKINIVPQDIGRVLLNLFNNAFYAVNEKKKSHELSAMSYETLVSIQTKKVNDKIEIRVEDNGNGIPQNIIDKIFQPFFTTKPTGQGTGLGLSLAYDIITKEHNGSIKVESKEGEGSKFIIQLPVASLI